MQFIMHALPVTVENKYPVPKNILKMHRSSHTLYILKEKNDKLLQFVFSKKKNHVKIMRNWHVHVSAM